MGMQACHDVPTIIPEVFHPALVLQGMKVCFLVNRAGLR